jgi:transposase
MSLPPHVIAPVPEDTVRIARAAFPNGTPYMTLRDELGTIFQDEDFRALFPYHGPPGLPPWRLALVTIMQFRENLADRQAAEAVRARIDWKYLLGLELTDPGFDFSVLSEFRDRLLAGSAEESLLEKLLARCRTLGWLKARGPQRTDSTHVLAAIRVLNRLELVAETLRATLNVLATVAPDWLQALVPLAWYTRYGTRIEETRLPKTPAEREAYAQTVGEDGVTVLEAIDTPEAPAAVRALPIIATLRQTWQRHYERCGAAPAPAGAPVPRRVRWKTNHELPPAAEGIESPYDVEARYRHKRDTAWTGYMVHVSETCDPTTPHLLTHVHTTSASRHEAQCTTPIQQALVDKDLAPGEHLVDAAYVSAEILATSQAEQGIIVHGPTRPSQGWQVHSEGAYTPDQFTIDWDRQHASCPQGQVSTVWKAYTDRAGKSYTHIRFSAHDCQECPARPLCVRTKTTGRRLQLPPQAHYEALQETRAWYASPEGKAAYKRRAGIEGTLSQGVRAFGLRRTRYGGLAKTHLQHVATAAAINVERIVAWLDERSLASTRLSRFAALAPEAVRPPIAGV